jgi:hypothetical protein
MFMTFIIRFYFCFMENELPLNDLSVYYRQLEIIRATAEQIIKDFEIFGEKVEFSGNPDSAYSELKGQIISIISRLISGNFEKFLSLLYRIDLEEAAVKKIHGKPREMFEELVSEMIIQRELKKVIIRKYYKQ